MVVISDITVPSEDFALGNLLDEYPDIDIEIERIVPLQDGVMPLVWVANAPLEEVEGTIRADSLTKDVRVVTDADERSLFEIRWSSEINGLIQSMIANDVQVLTADGDEDEWEFRLQFLSRSDLTSFREQCGANDVDIRLRRLYNPSIPDEDRELTGAQTECVMAALDMGYWNVPREHTLGEVADRVGISTNAASQRLRRGLEKLVEREVTRGT
ncbi:helix-turn-helix domain-containing protein [Halomicroarcula limicola]|uniref:Helix-turn-helix domain-containing protein n=1 Tax=Haloarcula limicola TaxID=1429915 RepID=A0A8J7Y2F3_9EURY|nr:helix-turn-helix domain-containing protein [Halomicroarcula limicola]MBV0922792.1 helix-turn-helix domain-containing protein [Halomicroarcula limicola]